MKVTKFQFYLLCKFIAIFYHPKKYNLQIKNKLTTHTIIKGTQIFYFDSNYILIIKNLIYKIIKKRLLEIN